MPPPVPVAPCVDSGIAYDDFAETVERIHDVFLVCFCAIHRNFPLSPTWGGAALFTVAFINSEGGSIELSPLLLHYLLFSFVEFFFCKIIRFLYHCLEILKGLIRGI